MTSNKKLIALLVFVGAMALTFMSAFVSMNLSSSATIEYMSIVIQYATTISFYANLLLLTTIALLISDMN